MAVCLINPSFTLDVVGEGVPIPWCKEKAFRERLRARGLKESQVSKVWRMYTDRDFILRHAVKGFGYLVDWSHLSGMATELCVHGRYACVTGAWVLSDLIDRAGCFKVWYNHDGEFVQFASPMFQTDDILTFPNGVSEVRNSLP